MGSVCGCFAGLEGLVETSSNMMPVITEEPGTSTSIRSDIYAQTAESESTATMLSLDSEWSTITPFSVKEMRMVEQQFGP